MSEHPLGKSRNITERWVIEGALVLTTPTHLGNGDTDATTDMPLLLDEATGKALLPGTSLAGALRNYLNERTQGYGHRSQAAQGERAEIDALRSATVKLLGGEKGDDEGAQSALIIEDALAGKPKIELRDGVKIDPLTRTAKLEKRGNQWRGQKYDLELLEAGTSFNLRLELLVSENSADEVKRALAIALSGLAQGEITLGLRKRRGFGRCYVPKWAVTEYDLRQPTGLLSLAGGGPSRLDYGCGSRSWLGYCRFVGCEVGERA